MGKEVGILHQLMVSLVFSASLLIFLIIAPLGVSFLTSMMNFPSSTDNKNSEKPAGINTCFYCKKVFTSHQPLAGHVRSHHARVRSAWWTNFSGSSSNSIGVTGNSPIPLSSNQPGNAFAGVGNNQTFFSNKSTPVHARSFAPSGSTAATGFALNPSSCFGLTVACQLNTDEGRTYQDGYPFLYGRTLEISEHEHGYDEGRSYMTEGSLTCKEGKRMYTVNALGNDGKMRASKQFKIAPNMPVEREKSQTKDLTLTKDVENSFSGSGISFDAEQEVPADIDLSLHL